MLTAIRRFILGSIGFLIIVFLSGFAVLNRHTIYVVWSPVEPPLTLPLYLVILAFLGFGFVLGVLMKAPHGKNLKERLPFYKTTQDKFRDSLTTQKPAS